MIVFQIEMQAGSLLPDASNNVFKYNIFIKSAIRYFLCYAWMVTHNYLVSVQLSFMLVFLYARVLKINRQRTIFSSLKAYYCHIEEHNIKHKL